MPLAIGYFLRQDYPHKELIVLDDGDDAVADLVPGRPAIRYMRLDRRPWAPSATPAPRQARRSDRALGRRRLASPRTGSAARCGAAGERAPRSCGISAVYYSMSSATGRAWRYALPGRPPALADRRHAAIHPRLLAPRAVPGIQIGEDTRFVWSQPIERAAVPPDYSFYVAMIPSGNTAPKSRAAPTGRAGRATYARSSAPISIATWPCSSLSRRGFSDSQAGRPRRLAAHYPRPQPPPRSTDCKARAAFHKSCLRR